MVNHSIGSTRQNGKLIAETIPEEDRKPMEINLSNMVWPGCVLRCNEALAQLQPGEDLTITLIDHDVVDNILLLIKSKPDLRSIASRESESYRITVHRLHPNTGWHI
jgi:TusA-related sulfurtransferase